MGIYDDASWGGIGDELKRTGRGALGLDRPSSNYTDAGATDPDANGRNPNRGPAPSRVPVTQGDMKLYADARDRYDPLGVKRNTKASSEAEEHIKSLYGASMTPQGQPLPAGRMDKVNEAKALTDRISNDYFKPSTGSLPVPGLDLAEGPMRSASQGGGSQQPTDPWKAMAQQLAQYSAQRAAPQFQAPQQMGGVAVMRDRNEEENAEKTRRWAMQDIASMRDPRQAALMAQMFQHDQGDQTQRRGQDIQEGVSGRGQDIQSRGQDIQAGVSTRGQDVQARGQEMGLAGQFFNQQATGLNQAAHDERSARMQKELEELKQKDPKTAAAVEYYLGNARESEAKTKLYGVQTEAFKNELELGKGPAGMYNKRLEAAAKIAQSDPDSAKLLMKQATDDYHRAMFELEKKNGKPGVQGYADGGQVESAEQLLARMKAKYGGAPSPQTEQPTPQPAPQQPAPQQPAPQQPAPQQPKTWSEKMRDVATGGLERRMQGYADGGSIFADDSAGGLKARLAAMQSMNNGASVEQAYGGTPKFGEYSFDDSTDLGSAGGYGSQRGLNFAQGGPIDVSGRQVLGAGTGKSDSLPAIIDGEHPAALSTDEFVMPVEAVRHFGLAKLNKMVEQSRKGLDTGRKQA